MADDLGPTLPEPGAPPDGGAGSALAAPDTAPDGGALQANTTPHVPQPTAEPDTTEITDPMRGEGSSRATPDGPAPA